jgi:hypothetical protein
VPEFRYHFFEEGISFSILDKITITPIAGTILIAALSWIFTDLTCSVYSRAWSVLRESKPFVFFNAFRLGLQCTHASGCRYRDARGTSYNTIPSLWIHHRCSYMFSGSIRGEAANSNKGCISIRCVQDPRTNLGHNHSAGLVDVAEGFPVSDTSPLGDKRARHERAFSISTCRRITCHP